MRFFSTTIIKNTAATFFVVALLFSGFSCSKEKPDKIKAVTNRAKVPKLHTTEVTTVISDSGITRYRIYTKLWDIFDKAPDPYWNFPKGIHLEKFNEDLTVDANLHANTAKYFDRRKVWELKGKVRAINIKGEMFETEHLFYNQMEQKIYSDTFIRITQRTKIMTGVGFESNQDMTKYHIMKLKGILAVEEGK